MARSIPGLLLAAVLLLPTAAAAQDESQPEFWEAGGLDAGEALNLRQEASTAADVVAEIARGTVLRNLGCVGDGDGRWCEVELADGGPRGWASARYLVEHDPEPVAEAPAVPGIPPTGTVLCQLGGEADETCPFVTRGKEDGAIELIVTFPDGFERILDFQAGEVFSPDPTDEVEASRGDGVTVVLVNDVERIEVPDAVVAPQ